MVSKKADKNENGIRIKKLDFFSQLISKKRKERKLNKELEK